MIWLQKLFKGSDSIATTNQVDRDNIESVKRVYELAIKQREFEIAQLTQRNNFFMIFQGVLIGGLVQSQGAAAGLINFMLCFTGMAISLFQIGMAGGAKYWQVRWEVATRDLELHLLEALRDNPRRMHQLFTVDKKHLDNKSIKRLLAINTRGARKNDQLAAGEGFIQKLVTDDLNRSGEKGVHAWMTDLAVKRKWSVSKIPLWVGFFLCLFWTTLWLNTFTFDGNTALQLIGKSLKLAFDWSFPTLRECLPTLGLSQLKK